MHETASPLDPRVRLLLGPTLEGGHVPDEVRGDYPWIEVQRLPKPLEPAAAMKLLQAGKSVVVLEANDRVGGRVLTLPTGPQPNQVTEAGAEWIAATGQKRIIALCNQLGIKRFPTNDKGKTVYYDGQAH